MKQPCGAKPAKSCTCSMHWIVASHKREGAVSASAAGQTCWPMDAPTIDLPELPISPLTAELYVDQWSRRVCPITPQASGSPAPRPDLARHPLGLGVKETLVSGVRIIEWLTSRACEISLLQLS
jgi:hypothetical protein